MALLFRRFASTAARNILVKNEASWPSELLSQAQATCSVWPNFITEDEEKSLFAEIEPHLKRLKYEKAHWDDQIYLYREREQRKWQPQNMEIIQRIMDKSFDDESMKRSTYIHILDLHEDGHIRPHIDATRYCGRVVTGVSLLSDSIMRLRHKDHKDNLIVDLLLPRLSLYKIWDTTRYEFTHEILDNKESQFNGEPVFKGRRISLICRDLPSEQQADQKIDFKTIQ